MGDCVILSDCFFVFPGFLRGFVVCATRGDLNSGLNILETQKNTPEMLGGSFSGVLGVCSGGLEFQFGSGRSQLMGATDDTAPVSQSL